MFLSIVTNPFGELAPLETLLGPRAREKNPRGHGRMLDIYICHKFKRCFEELPLFWVPGCALDVGTMALAHDVLFLRDLACNLQRFCPTS